jgi:hypothetical protein
MNVVVVHAGALGDGVLIWPLLRALGRLEHTVKLVTHDSAGRLAAVELNHQLGSPIVSHVSLDGPRWAPLWQGAGGTPDSSPEVDVIVSFLADDTTEGGRRWLAGARESFPNAELVLVGAPGSVTRAALWKRFRVGELGGVEPRLNPQGPVVLSVGAGGRHKRWPLDRWSQLTDRLQALPHPPRVQIIAGPVEDEQFSKKERAAFNDLVRKGHWSGTVNRLNDLANALRLARCVISADSGPAHLASQLGVRTLALFGPTDATIWSPVGPAVLSLAPPACTPDMAWLDVETVFNFLASQEWAGER